MALINCLNKFPMKGERAIAGPDRETLRQSAKEYEARGLSPQEAEVKAVQDMLDHFEAERQDIQAQVIKAYEKARPTAIAKPNAAPLNIATKRETPKVETAKPVVKQETKEELPADAWHRVMEGVPGVPKFGELPQSVQDEWKALDPKDRTRVEAVELAQSPQRSEAKRTKPSERVENVRKELREFMGGPLNPAKVQVVQSIDEIPRAIREAAEKDGPLTNTQGFVHNGKAWLIAGNIDEGQVKAVFLHEVGSHIGLENALNEHEYGQLVDTIKEWAARNDGSLEHLVARAAMGRIYSSTAQGQMNNRELVAYAVEEAMTQGVNPSLDYKSELGRFLSRVWLAFKKALDKFGWHVKDKPTAQDLVDLAYGVARMEMSARFREKDGTQRSFIGMKSETAKTPDNLANYMYARMLDGQGANPSSIWQESGWMKGPDGKWRMEIPDDGAALKHTMDGVHNLEDVLDHPELYQAYPHMREQKVEFHEGRDTYYHAAMKRAVVGRKSDNILGSLLHELQHAVQEHEGFARGTSPRDQMLYTTKNIEKAMKAVDSKILDPLVKAGVSDRVDVLKVATTLRSALQGIEATTDPKQRQQMWDELGDYMSIPSQSKTQLMNLMYHLTTGEIEAYNTEGRMGMSAKHRLWEPPHIINGQDNQIVLTQSQRSERAAQAIEQMPPAVRPYAKGIFTSINDLTKKGFNFFALTDDLIDMARKTLPSVDRYRAAQQARSETLLEHENQVDKIVQLYSHIPTENRGTGPGSVNAFIFDSTRTSKWGYKLDPLSFYQPDPEMSARFNALKPESQALVKAVFKYGHDTLREEQATIKQIANEEYANDPDGKAKFIARYDKLMSLRGSGPYAPLKRFGDYVAVGKSRAYLDAVLNNDKAAIEQLQSDPKHYYVEFAATLAQAQAIKESIEPTFHDGESSFSQRAASDHDNFHDSFKAMGRLRRAVSGMKGVNTEELQNVMRDLEMRILAESSARKSEIARKNVAGASKDMMRSLATQGRANAYFLATMKHSNEIETSLLAMLQDAKRPGGDRADGMRYWNELYQRHAQSQTYDTPIWQNRMKRVTSFWMIATNPAFYFQQLMQTATITAPYVSGKHGFFKTEKTMMRAYKEMAPFIKSLKSLNDRPDLSLLPADVQEMLRTLTSHGKIDLGIDIEMGSWVAKGSDPKGLNKGMQKIDSFFRGAATAMETINRTAASITAYRLEKAKQLLDGKEERVAHDIATRYAEKVVHVTHGSYDGFNTPRALSTAFPGARVITQFRRYQIIQLSLLARLFHGSFKGATAEERAVARKALMFSLGHAFVLTGAAGTPGVAALAWIASKMLKGDDEPDTDAVAEDRLRKWIGDEDIANLLLRGAPAAFGVDMSQKLGYSNTFSLTPFVQSDPFTKKGYQDTVLASLGPTFSLGGRWANGADLMRHGETYKGLEQMVPNGVGNAMKGMRFASDGVTLRNGDVVLSPDEISFIDATMQGMGLPTTTLTERSFRQGVKMNYEQYYTQKSGEVKADYMRAYKTNDAEDMQDAREAWNTLQDSRARNGFKPEPLSVLLKSPMAQGKRERQVEGGLEERKTNRDFVRDLVSR